MRRSPWSLAVLFVTLLWSRSDGSCENAEPLFFIEWSKSKKVVQYDVHTTQDGDLAEEAPVFAYWILGNGKRRELTRLQRMYAFGIKYQKRLDNHRYEIALAGLVQINGKEAILERLYIECQQRLIGPPKVLYLDVFCHDEQSNLTVTERIFSDEQT